MTKAKTPDQKFNVTRGEFDSVKSDVSNGLRTINSDVTKALNMSMDNAKSNLKEAENTLFKARNEAISKLEAAASYFHQAEKMHMKAASHLKAAVWVYVASLLVAAAMVLHFLVWG